MQQKRSTIVHLYIYTPCGWLKDYFMRPTMFHEETDLERLRQGLHLSQPFLVYLVYLLCLMLMIGLVSLPLAFALRIILFRITIGQFPVFSTSTILPLLSITALGELGGMLISLAFGLVSGKKGIVPFLMIGALTADIPFGRTLAIPQAISSHPIITLVLLPFVAGFAAFLGSTISVFIHQKKLINLYSAGKIWIVTFFAVFISFIGTSILKHFHIDILPISEKDNIMIICAENVIAGFLLSYMIYSTDIGIVLNILIGLLFSSVPIGIMLFLHNPTPHSLYLPIAAFFIGYILGIFQIPCCIYSYISMGRIYHKCRATLKNNAFSLEVFNNLKHSAPYHEKHVWFTLPWLKATLEIAVIQDQRLPIQGQNTTFTKLKNTITIIDEIVKNPKQCSAAYTTILRVILDDLLRCNDLNTIAQITTQQLLDDYLLREPRLIYSEWIATLNNLNDISKYAARYRNESNRQQRLTLLHDMLIRLEEISNNSIPHHFQQNKELEDLTKITSSWTLCITNKQLQLQNSPSEIGSLHNRYTPNLLFNCDHMNSEDRHALRRNVIFDAFLRAFPSKDNLHLAYGLRLHLVGEPGTGKVRRMTA